MRYGVMLVVIGLAACTPSETTRPDTAPAPDTAPETPAPPTIPTIERGRVSLYGHEFAGRTTASGERFDPEALTMAHRTLPFGTRVRITNLSNQRSVEVVVNDRGPAVRGRIADLSLAAARHIGMITDGVIDALLEIVAPAKAH
jgi:rare lipoprotein A